MTKRMNLAKERVGGVSDASISEGREKKKQVINEVAINNYTRRAKTNQEIGKKKVQLQDQSKHVSGVTEDPTHER